VPQAAAAERLAKLAGQGLEHARAEQRLEISHRSGRELVGSLGVGPQLLGQRAAGEAA
jgi:hypothetical protein